MPRTADSVTSISSALDAVVLLLLGQQVAQRDVDLLVLGVAGEPDHLHPVEQRRRDVHRVRRRDEHRVRQVEVDLDVVVAEGVVLLGVEHLEQRRRRIAAEVHAELVDLVEQEQRIARPDLGQRSAAPCPASSRCRCGGGRGSRPRRARRRAPCERTCARSRAPRSGRARSCRRPEARPGTGSATSSCRRAAAPRGTRGCGP